MRKDKKVESQGPDKLHPIPAFASEKEEREWWAKQDLTELERAGQAYFHPEPFSEPIKRTYGRPRGGPRAGAGRKQIRDKKVTFKLSNRAITLLEKLSEAQRISKVMLVERAIDLLVASGTEKERHVAQADTRNEEGKRFLAAGELMLAEAAFRSASSTGFAFTWSTAARGNLRLRSGL